MKLPLLYQRDTGSVAIHFATTALLLSLAIWFGFAESANSANHDDGDNARDLIAEEDIRSPEPPIAATPALHISIDPSNLFDGNKGILINRERANRQWEKSVSLQLRTASSGNQKTEAGMRLHGSKNARKSRLNQVVSPGDLQYELFFREEYTSTIPLSKVWFDSGSHQIARMVIENGNVTAKQAGYLIAREAGLPTPVSLPMEVIINGEIIGTRLVRESVNRTQWTYREGTHQIDFFSSRDKEYDEEWSLYSELASWYRRLKRQVSMRAAAGYIDIENFTKNIAVMMICGSNDWEQWAVYRNPQKANRWKWINWGLDSCISDRWQTSSNGLAEQHWLQVVASMNPHTKKLDFNYRNLQTLIFIELINGDPEYRSYFIDTMEILLEKLDSKQFDFRARLSSGENTLIDLDSFLSDRRIFIQDGIRRTIERIR